jgi:hypothetical protein
MNVLEVGKTYKIVTVKPHRRLDGVYVSAYDPGRDLFALRPAGQSWKGTNTLYVRPENVTEVVV